jgi:hypothetical protein
VQAFRARHGTGALAGGEGAIAVNRHVADGACS